MALRPSQRFLLALIPAAVAPAYLTTFHAAPGPLLRGHAGLPGVGERSGCAACHAPAGLDAGCLGCHAEVAVQLREERGYHHLLAGRRAGECAGCHSEHRGEDFRALNAASWPGGKEAFQHTSLAGFGLAAGRHLQVMDTCDLCHTPGRIAALPSRDRGLIRCQETYLGLDEACRRCHEDVHRDRLGRTCERCHDQARWTVTRLDHSAFPLEGEHRAVACARCHVPRPDPVRPGARVDPVAPTAGRRCSDCHLDPHPARPGQTTFSARETDCAACHDERGFAAQVARFDLDGHAPGTFPLLGEHREAACRTCHPRPDDPAPGPALSVPAARAALRATDCAACHADPHATPASGASQLAAGGRCAGCHDERGWAPARFDAAEHARLGGLPLSGPHARVGCAACHAPARDRVRGDARRACADCHASPHRAPALQGDCARCHASERSFWRGGQLTAAEHAALGFPLRPPHDIACARCHRLDEPDRAVRFRSVAPGDCAACHRDVHLAQFARPAARAAGAPATAPPVAPGCADCHAGPRFVPSTFDAARHATAGFPLAGPHAAVACRACHPSSARALPDGQAVDVREFRGRPRACKACHESPHGEQLAGRLRAGDCTSCHAPTAPTFAIARFDHDRTAFPLGEAHARVRCDRCHVARPTDGPPDRVYRPVATACGGCHADPHGGQFGPAAVSRAPGAQPAPGRCERCHDPDGARWAVPSFDHARTRFPLDGAHAQVPCAACHLPLRLRDGRTVVRYRPLGTACQDCHGAFDGSK